MTYFGHYRALYYILCTKKTDCHVLSTGKAHLRTRDCILSNTNAVWILLCFRILSNHRFTLEGTRYHCSPPSQPLTLCPPPSPSSSFMSLSPPYLLLLHISSFMVPSPSCLLLYHICFSSTSSSPYLLLLHTSSFISSLSCLLLPHGSFSFTSPSSSCLLLFHICFTSFPYILHIILLHISSFMSPSLPCLLFFYISFSCLLHISSSVISPLSRLLHVSFSFISHFLLHLILFYILHISFS